MAVKPDLKELEQGYRFGWHDPASSVFTPKRGLSPQVVEEISELKSEPEWMRKYRLKALKHFEGRPMPWWGADLSDIDFQNIYYFIRSTEKQAKSWEELPEDIRGTWDKLGIPEAEKKFLGGVSAQYESEVVYHKIKDELDKIGVVFTDMDTALREHEDLVKEYFGTIIPANDNKFAALNSSVWSGGSFVYVPEGVHVDIPLQAYFRINAENMGQFERTLIIAEPGSYVHYVEGCLLKGERVELSGGRSLPIEQVALGDEVIDERGRPTTVTGVMELEYDGPVYRFGSETGGNSFTVTREHPLLVVRRKDVVVKRKARNGWLPEVSTWKLRSAKPQWVVAEEVEAGDFLVYPKVRPEPGVPLHPAFMRLAGYYLAEGSAQLINGCKALTFSFHSDETSYIEEVRDLCRELWGARGSVTWHKDRRAATVVVYTAGGYEAMGEHVGSRSWAKQLSPLLFSQSDVSLRALIDAYVNGDGNRVERNGNTPWVRCHTTSYEWAMQLQSILARLGVFATVRLSRKGGPAVIQDRDVLRHDLWIVQWTEDKVHSEIRETKNAFLVPIKEVAVEEYMGPVYNIETESQAYSVRGFATHNCSAPIYTTDSLHSAVVEIIAKPGSRVRYTTIQNWSTNVYNLVTKRAAAYEDSIVEWIDGNIGSKVTMKYPSIYLLGKGARGEVLSVAYAGEGMHTDAGGKAIHAAPYTTSIITSKSVSKGGGRTGYRGLIRVEPEAHHAKSNVRCDALILDEDSRSDTYPYIEVEEESAAIGHEATVSRVGDDQLFYLMSRGLTEAEATAMIVNGFIEPITRELPMEYAVELNRLIELQMEGSVG